MTKRLTNQTMLRLMNEVYDERLKTLSENVDIIIDPGKKDGEQLVSSELKIKHKSSGLLYTVDSVGPRDMILRNPEGKKFIVNKSEIESDYQLA